MLLFDIDGTLLLTGGCGKIAFDQTFEEMFGIRNACGSFKPHGKTDPVIIQELMDKNLHRELEPAEYETLCTRYLFHFGQALQNSHGFRLMPGVAACLEKISQSTNSLLGLATGNLEPAAWLKLEHGGIRDHFQFGGFGSDSPDRTQLTRIAVERGQKIVAQSILPENIYVVGDTPYDVQAAKALQLKSIAVATGIHNQKELLSDEPTHCLPDLTDVNGILQLLTV